MVDNNSTADGIAKKTSCIADYTTFLDKSSTQELRKYLLKSATQMYNLASVDLWTKISSTPSCNPSELAGLEKRIAQLGEELPKITDAEIYNRRKNEKNSLTDIYLINELWQIGDDLANIGTLLLSDKYNSKADELINLICPKIDNAKRDIAYEHLGRLLNRWVFGETIVADGNNSGITDFKQKYFDGMLFLECGLVRYDNFAKARLEKQILDNKSAAIYGDIPEDIV